MSTQRLVQEQRKNSQICIEILMQCKTRQQTITALDKIARILRESDDPVAEAAKQAYHLSQSMDEASVLKVKDDFIDQFRAFLAATESIATASTGPIAADKPKSTVESEKPKGKRGCIIAACGSVILAIVLIAIAAVAFSLIGGG